MKVEKEQPQILIPQQQLPQILIPQQQLLTRQSTDPANKSTDLVVYEYQVAGKTAKYVDERNGLIYKMYDKTENEFFQFAEQIKMNNPCYSVKKFFPSYLGVVDLKDIKLIQYKQQNQQQQGQQQSKRMYWINHISSRNTGKHSFNQLFIKLTNQTFGFTAPNIIDLKLGIKKDKSSNVKFQRSPTNTHQFRINGMAINLHKYAMTSYGTNLQNQNTYEQIFLSKYYGQNVTIDEIPNHFGLFFSNGEKIDLSLLQHIITNLTELILSFKAFRGAKLISASLFIAYDAKDHSKSTLKLIDFQKYQYFEEEDQNISCGLINIHQCLKNVQENYVAIERHIQQRTLNCFLENYEVVPESKKKKYQ